MSCKHDYIRNGYIIECRSCGFLRLPDEYECLVGPKPEEPKECCDSMYGKCNKCLQEGLNELYKACKQCEKKELKKECGRVECSYCDSEDVAFFCYCECHKGNYSNPGTCMPSCSCKCHKNFGTCKPREKKQLEIEGLQMENNILRNHLDRQLAVVKQLSLGRDKIEMEMWNSAEDRKKAFAILAEFLLPLVYHSPSSHD